VGKKKKKKDQKEKGERGKRTLLAFSSVSFRQKKKKKKPRKGRGNGPASGVPPRTSSTTSVVSLEEKGNLGGKKGGKGIGDSRTRSFSPKIGKGPEKKSPTLASHPGGDKKERGGKKRKESGSTGPFLYASKRGSPEREEEKESEETRGRRCFLVVPTTMISLALLRLPRGGEDQTTRIIRKREIYEVGGGKGREGKARKKNHGRNLKKGKEVRPSPYSERGGKRGGKGRGIMEIHPPSLEKWKIEGGGGERTIVPNPSIFFFLTTLWGGGEKKGG